MNPDNRKRGIKIILSGYYGFDNCGDEALLWAIIHCLKSLKPDIRITVLSGNPRKTRELYAVDAVNRWNPVRIALALISCRLLVSGGGSLLQDVTSGKSLSYYLLVIRIAAFFKKRVMVYSQGIGPLINEKNRNRVQNTLTRCSIITVRDKRSAELLREIGVNRDIQVTCDPVMAFSPDDINFEDIMEILHDIGISRPLVNISGDASETGTSKINKIPQARKLLMVVMRCWDNNRHISPVAELLDAQIKRGWDVLLTPAHYPGDMEALDKVTELMSEKPYLLDKCLTARQFLALTACADRVFSMRLHGLICALAAGTPMLGLSYDPKVDGFMEEAGLSSYCLHFEDFEYKAAERLMSDLDSISPQLQQDLAIRTQKMRKLAWESAKNAVNLLN